MLGLARLKLAGALIFSLFSFALFVYGSVSEVLSDSALLTVLESASVAHISEEITFLKVYIIYYIVLACFTVLFFAIISFHDCRLTYMRLKGENLEKQQRRLNTSLRVYLLSVATVGSFKTILYGSLLNKFRAQGLWDGSPDFDISALYVVVPYFGARGQSSWTIPEHLKVAITITAFNIFRTMVLFIPMTVITDEQIWKKLGKQVLFIFPSIFVAAVVGFKGVTAVMVEHYTQRYYTEQQIYSVPSSLINSVVCALFGIVVMASLLVRVTQLINDLLHPLDVDTVSPEALQEISKVGTLGFYNEMYAISDPPDKSRRPSKRVQDQMERDKEHAREVLVSFMVRVVFSSSIFMYGVIEFALAIDVHERTGVWDWYFTADTVFTGILFIGALIDCCCSFVQFSRMLRPEEY